MTLEETGVIKAIKSQDYKVIMRDTAKNNVLILAGMNKVVTDVESYIKIARDIAAPPNAIRLNRKTPCASTGKCEDCYSAECMCGQFVVTRRSGILNRIKVILIGEELGY